jgi:S-DNA-T family DNA segregation ATPase FtsK/SpoIIIE
MPHGLIAGMTGSGKSVCINSVLISLLYKNTPEELRLILIDPKMVELAAYDEIPHLATPVITDTKMAAAALRWVVEEMENRFNTFKSYRVRDIKSYNELMMRERQTLMPRIVIIIDELADLMIVAASEVESNIQRITQKARAAGIHLIVATQRPSTDIIRGSIKNNIPVRIAFKVASAVDSVTILDHGGADKLLGLGDMLYSSGISEQRLQGAFVTDKEINRVTAYLRQNGTVNYLFTEEQLQKEVIAQETGGTFNDEMFEEVARYVVENNNASNNRLTQVFNMGFNRTNDMLNEMERVGIVSGTVRGKQREVLVTLEELEEILEKRQKEFS